MRLRPVPVSFQIFAFFSKFNFPRDHSNSLLCSPLVHLEKLMMSRFQTCGFINCNAKALWSFLGEEIECGELCSAHKLQGMHPVVRAIATTQAATPSLLSTSNSANDADFSPDDGYVTDDTNKEMPAKKRAKKLFKSWEKFCDVPRETFEGIYDPDTTLLNIAKKVLTQYENSLKHSDGTCFHNKDCKMLDSGKSLYVERYCAAKARHSCHFGCKLVVDVEEKKGTIYTTNQHDHSLDVHGTADGSKNSNSGTWGVPPGCRSFIDALIVRHSTAKEIHRALRDEKVDHLPHMKQLQNYIQRRRLDLKSDLRNETLAEFLEWCAEHQWKDSLEEDEVFVLPGSILPAQSCWNDKVTDLNIVVCLSTKALLRNAISQQDSTLPPFLCFDGTYNLLANGCPTLVIGTLDWMHKYRAISVVYTTHEDQGSYEHAIDSVAEGIATCFEGRTLKAEYTMQDGAPAIFNAVSAKLNPKDVGSCWYHLKAQLRKRKSKFAKLQNYERFCVDVDVLHASQSPTEYHEAATLFVAKWSSIEPEMTEWFDKEYFGWRQTFYACLTPPGIPSTNDPQENNNKLIKQFGTKHKLLSTGGFLAAMRHELKHESHEVEMGGPFPTSFTLDYGAWRVGQEWLAAVTPEAIIPNRTKTTFYVPSTTFRTKHGCHLSRQELKAFLVKRNQKVEPIRGEGFDEYVSRRNSFYDLKPLTSSNTRSEFIVFSCSCVQYWKFANCKHALGVGISEGKFLIPAKFSLAAMGAKGKRGRKKIISNTCYGAAESMVDL